MSTPSPFAGSPVAGSRATGDPTLLRAARTGGLLALAAAALTVAAGWFTVLTPGVPLLMAVVIVQLARMRAGGPGRRAAVGLTLWTIHYLTQIVPATGIGITGITAVDIAVGIVFFVLGVAGPLMAGTAVVRAGVLTGWRRWTPLALGVVQFLAVLQVALGLPLLVFLWPLILVLTILLGVALLTTRPAATPRSSQR